MAPVASAANGLHIELKEGTTGRVASRLLPLVKRSGQKGILSVLIITKVIEYILRHGRGDNMNFPRQTLAFIDRKTHEDWDWWKRLR